MQNVFAYPKNTIGVAGSISETRCRSTTDSAPNDDTNAILFLNSVLIAWVKRVCASAARKRAVKRSARNSRTLERSTIDAAFICDTRRGHFFTQNFFTKSSGGSASMTLLPNRLNTVSSSLISERKHPQCVMHRCQIIHLKGIDAAT